MNLTEIVKRKDLVESFKSASIFSKASFLLTFVAIVLFVPVLVLSVTKDASTDNTFISSIQDNVTGTSNGLIGAEVVYQEGEVSVSSDNVEWVELSDTTVLSEGDYISTSEDGRAIINLDDGSALRFAGATTVALTSLNPDDIDVSIVSGTVYARVAKLDREFSIISDTAVYESLGTAYLVDTDEETERLEVYESKVKVLEQEKEITVEEGKSLVTRSDEDAKVGEVEELDREKVTSDEFVKWNREKDFENAEYKKDLGYLGDIEPPMLKIESPESGITTEAVSMPIVGLTEPSATVKINGEVVDVAESGNFEKSVGLTKGENTFTVKAYDKAGNYSKVVIKITKVVPDVTPDPTPTPTPGTGISINGVSTDYGVKLTWTVSGVDINKGFKLVKSLDSNPVYPGDSYVYISNSDTRSYTWDIYDGKTYHFRVCRYTPDNSTKCDKYSQDITVKAPLKNYVVDGIALSQVDGVVKWIFDGDSQYGVKVVWSLNAHPTYPTRDTDTYKYFSDEVANKTLKLSDYETGPGTYYVRACAYKAGPNGECTPYSNEVSVVIP